jgi:hypothetical protein
MPIALRATTEQVTIAWLKGIVGDRVSTTLPKDNATWAASGFCVVTTVGGAANMYVPLREPVTALDCWAVNPDSAKPPWGKAACLAEAIQAGCYDASISRLLTLPGNYPRARVLSAYTAYEPRRIPDDAASYARFSLGLALHWIEVPT